MENKLNILICTGIYPPDIGGPATYSKLLFEELPKKGINVEVLSFGEVRKYPKIFRHFLYFLKVFKKGKKNDLLYAQDPVSVGLPTCLASLFLRKKFVLKVVGDYAWEQQQQRKEVDFVTPENFQEQKFDLITEIRRNIERWVAKRATKIVVPSEYLKKIVMMWGVSEDKVNVILNAFALEEVSETEEELRKQFGFENHNSTVQKKQEKIIFSVGRLVPWKGFETLIEIVKDLPDVKLFIAGDGPEKEKLNNKINKLELENKVFLLGRLEQSELLKKIKASDVFVLNTGYEGLSHQLLEVMSLGTPIITTNVGGNPETIENGKEGLLVEYNNKEKLKEVISFIIENKSVSEDLARNAKEKLRFFDKDRMLNEISEELKSILNY